MLYRDYLKSKYQNTAVKLANAEGVPCVLEYSKGKNMKNYEVYGNSVQDGTPTPESPVEIQSVGDLTKNLLPNDWESGFISVSSGANQNSSTYVRTKDYFTFDIAKNYYISSDSIATRATISWYFYDENKNFISRFVSYKNRTIGTSGCQVTIPTNTVFFRLAVLTTDVNIKVQIEEGTTATEYEPYRKYDIPIVNSGKNMLSYPYNYTTRTENGLTFTDNGDGSIKINGTPTIQTGFMFRNQIIDAIDKTKAYVLSGGKDGNVALRIDFYNGTTWKNLVNTGNDGKAIIDFTKMNFDYTRVSVSLIVKANTVCDNITIKPQLELGKTATEYEPYRVPVTANIYLDEPLRKIGDYADYIDFKGQRVVRKVKEITFDGTENWVVYQKSSNMIYLSIMNNNLSRTFDGYSTHFRFDDKPTTNPSFVIVNRSTLGNVVVRLYQKSDNIVYSTADEFKTFLAEQYNSGNPVKLLCHYYNTVEETISLPALKTFKGTNVMSVDTSVQPSNIKAKYIRT